MIELPEAHALAAQCSQALAGKTVRWAQAAQTPHKFAFWWGDPATYAETLTGRTMGPAKSSGGRILLAVDPGWTLALGDGGERLRLHQCAADLPKKHQLALEFSDGTAFSVTIQGWGMLQLVPDEELDKSLHHNLGKPSPLGEDFTAQWLLRLAEDMQDSPRMSVKEFLAAGQRIPGLGNGCLQDILLLAGIDPRRKLAACSREDLLRLHRAAVEMLREAARLGGRDTEIDLFGNPGGYKKLLDARAVGRPCPRCGQPIGKIAFMGGACYVCAHCQQ